MFIMLRFCFWKDNPERLKPSEVVQHEQMQASRRRKISASLQLRRSSEQQSTECEEAKKKCQWHCAFRIHAQARRLIELSFLSRPHSKGQKPARQTLEIDTSKVCPQSS